MTAPIIGSITLTNVYHKHGRKRRHIRYTCDQFPDGIYVPLRVIDPKDQRAVKRGDQRTLRVLKWWYVLQTTGKTHAPEADLGLPSDDTNAVNVRRGYTRKAQNATTTPLSLLHSVKAGKVSWSSGKHAKMHPKTLKG